MIGKSTFSRPRLIALGVAVTAVTLAIGPARPAVAGETGDAVTSPLEIGVFGGLRFYDKKHGLGRFEDDFEGLSPDTGGIFGLRLTYNLCKYMGVEAEGFVSPTHTRFGGGDGGTGMLILGYRGSLVATLLPTGPVRPFVLAGYGGVSSFPSDTAVVPRDTDGMFHLGAGAKLPLSDTFGLRLDGRVLAPGAVASDFFGIGDETGFNGPDWEILLSAYLGLGGEKPAPPPPPPPPPPAPVDEDPDKDGISGSADKCPDKAEDMDGFQDEDGCPDPDNDGDGIADKDDKCPGKAEDKDGFQDEDGCPDPDNDGDGIADNDDKCPGEPETKNSYQDQDGCPDEVPAELKKFTGVIEGIKFKTKSADITKDSHAVLDKAIKVLVDFPDVKLEIGGHTDDVGKAEFNRSLSQKRADSVMKYLVDKGIAPARLTSVGYGMDKPIGDNKTKAGKAQNRRTEFTLR
jgi:OOP family OmpA-OmpF porin